MSAGENYAAEQSPAVPANAFAAQSLAYVPVSPAASVKPLADSDLPPYKPTSNLTEALSQYLAREMVKYNPDGPQITDDSGDAITQMPNIGAMDSEFANIPEVKNFKIPDWSAEAAALELTLTSDTSQASQEKYAEALNSIYSEYFLNPDLTSIGYKASTDVKPDDFKNAATVSDNALQETKSVPTPTPLADFQKALATTILYTKNMTALGANANDDPLKAELIMNAKGNDIDIALLNLQTQFQKDAVQKAISARPETKTGVTALVNNLLGIKTAYAFCPTWDFPSFGDFLRALAKDIEQMVLSLVLQTVKNMIVQELQNVARDFIRNAGAPRFVTNWLVYAANSLQRGAVLALNEATLALSSDFSGPIKLAMLSTIGNPAPKSTMAPPGQAFYNNMLSGGSWGTFGSLLAPTNNYFGAYLATHDYIAQESAKAQQAAHSEVAASGGFTGARTGETPGNPAPGFGTEKTCNKPQTNEFPFSSGGRQDALDSLQDWIADLEARGGLIVGSPECDTTDSGSCTVQFCNPGDTSNTQIKTPGDVVAAMAHNAVGQNGQLTISAQNIAGLITSILQSFLSTLINQSLSGLK